jgi:hypothetical protein
MHQSGMDRYEEDTHGRAPRVDPDVPTQFGTQIAVSTTLTIPPPPPSIPTGMDDWPDSELLHAQWAATKNTYGNLVSQMRRLGLKGVAASCPALRDYQRKWLDTVNMFSHAEAFMISQQTPPGAAPCNDAPEDQVDPDTQYQEFAEESHRHAIGSMFTMTLKGVEPWKFHVFNRRQNQALRLEECLPLISENRNLLPYTEYLYRVLKIKDLPDLTFLEERANQQGAAPEFQGSKPSNWHEDSPTGDAPSADYNQ